MMPTTDATSRVGESSGSVMARCLRSPVAPSRAAASWISFGMLFSPPTNSRNEKPNCCQT